ncbi:hypothetical protein CC86DRAFT_358321 [Ophiobolus disseminans]|uniref:Uncharacterized protein n=1 Tax=Ophiobolus disseminans TaxID=1469910 RepID=A0A6A6ZP66_9PLEO|nr:hypothetical protein CC86DRAFT_358321 [Ophiobolus disseminans]
MEAGSGPGYIDDVKDADPLLYHPHDVLILKYFPDAVLNSPARSNYHSHLTLARFYEKDGAPHFTPWPLPPPRPREELELGVEEWRSNTLRTIDTRISLYEPRPTIPGTTRPSTFTNTGLRPTICHPHCALYVTGILENVLRYAIPSAQYNAWNVSKAQKIAEAEWTKYNYPWLKNNIVWNSSFPKLVMFLDSPESFIPTLAKSSYLSSENSYDLCRNEWSVPCEHYERLA